MKIKKCASLLVLATVLSFANNSFAQRVIHNENGTNTEKNTEKDTKKSPATLKERLWYGGGIQLGFNSYNSANVFSFGVSPMVGYKIIEPLSVGPRVDVSYASLKQAGYKATSLWNIDAGVFVRFRVFRGLFLQGELTNEWFQEPIAYSNEKFKGERFNQRLGIGWNFGARQGGGSELGVFYNFAIANDINSYQNPLGYRFGFTWNF